MSNLLPKIHLNGEIPSLITVVPSHHPGGQDLVMVGNTIISPLKKNGSPPLALGQKKNDSPIANSTSLNGSPSQMRSQVSPPLRSEPLNRSSFEPKKLDFSLPGSQDVSYPAANIMDTSNMKPQVIFDLLAQQTYNELASRLARKPHSSPTSDKNANVSPITLAPTDYVPQIIDPALNFQSPQASLTHVSPQKSQSDVDLQGMSNVAHAYLEKQNQVMARILKDVEDYKKMEYIKQSMLLDQQFAGVLGRGYNGLGSPFQPIIGVMPPNMMQYPGYSPRMYSPSMYTLPTYPMYPPNMNPGEYNTPKSSNRKGHSTPDSNTSRTNRDQGRDPRRPRQGKQLLRSVGWALALPGLWFISTVKWAERRREQQIKMLEDKIPETLEEFIEYTCETIDRELKNLFNDKNSLVIVPPPGTNIKPADMDKRCICITEHLVAIIDGLSLKIDNGKLPPKFFQVLASLTEDDSVLPEGFLSSFEMNRLCFNIFGNLKQMNPARSKMLLASFVLIKGLLYFVIMRPWTVSPTVKEKNLNIKNLINLGSVLYHMTLDIIRENVPEADRYDSEPPFKASLPNFAALEPATAKKLDVIPDPNDDDDQEIISGFYNRDRLKAILDDRPSMAKEIKEAILDFLDVLYDISHKAYRKKEHVKKMFAAHMPR